MKSFFLDAYWRMSIVYLLFLYVCIHFLFIEFRLVSIKLFSKIFVGIIFFELILLNIFDFDLFYDFYLFVINGKKGVFLNYFLKNFSLILFNLSLLFLIRNVYLEITNRIKISVSRIFSSGVRGFSFMIALLFSIFFIIKYENFTLTCSNLYTNLYRFIDNVSFPLKLSIDEVNKMKSYIKVFDETDKIEYIGNNQMYTGNLTSYLSGKDFNLNLTGISNFTNQSILSGYLSLNIGEINNTNFDFNSFNNGIFNEIISNKQLIDNGFCQYLVKEISQKYKHSGFKFSVIFLITLMLRPVSRVIFFIFSFFGYLLMKILIFIKIYKKEKSFQQVDNLV